MTQQTLTVQVLLSCMHQTDNSIIQRSQLTNTHTLVINQCDIKQETWRTQTDKLRWLDTPTRGLSVSRNLAIQNAKADVCVIADDDEIFEDNVEEIIQKAYAQCPQADVVIFTIGNRPIKFGNKPRKLKKWELLQVNSVRISFKRASICQQNIQFDTQLGSGTENGGGEENNFLFDCYNNGLQIYFVPLQIATVLPNQGSQWFHGFNAKFFYNRGKSTRYMYGFWFACAYGAYFVLFKRALYNTNISTWQAAKNLFLGIWKNELGRKK